MVDRVDPSVRRLAATIARLQRDLRNVSVVPQLDRSSLDDSYINMYDAEGRLSGRVGRQADGAYTSKSLRGPMPATPAGVSGVGGPASVTITWDGSFEDGADTPTDFGVVEVWAAEDDFTDTAGARLLGHFANEAGGELTGRLSVGDWHVGLVCRSQSGRRSDVSDRVVVTVESVVDQSVIDDLEDKLDNMPSITWAADEPTVADGDGKPYGAVWRQVGGGEILGQWVWSGAAWMEQKISSNAVASLEVGKLVAGTLTVDTQVAKEIWAAKIAAEKIDAGEINTQSLGADTGFIGVLNSATIVGAVIKTAESGQRVELDSGHGIRVYNEDDELVLSADGNGDLVLGGDITLSGALTAYSGPNKVTVQPEGIALTSNTSFLNNKFSTWGNVQSLGFGPGTVYAVEYWFGEYRVRPYDATGDPGVAWDIAFSPDAVTADGSYVYLMNYHNGTGAAIETYDFSSNLLNSVTLSGELGHAFDSLAGNLYVATDTSIVVVDPLTGTQVRSWSEPSGTSSGLSTNAGDVYVATGTGKTVDVYSTSGTPVTSWSTTGDAVCIEALDDGVFVGTGAGRTIEMYTHTGELVHTWDTGVDADSLASDSLTLYVGSSSGRGVEAWTPPIFPTVTAKMETDSGRLRAVAPEFQGVTTADTLVVDSIQPADDNVRISRPYVAGNLILRNTDGEVDYEEPAGIIQIRRRYGGQDREVKIYAAASPVRHQAAIRLDEVDGGQVAGLYISGDGQLQMRTFDGSDTANGNRPLPFATAAGSVTVTYTSRISSVHVTFPAGRFTQAPVVIASANSSSGAVVDTPVSAVSTTGCTIHATRESSADTTVMWQAVQMTPSSAEG